MLKKLFITSLLPLLLSTSGIFASPILAADTQIYPVPPATPPAGNSDHNTTEAGWTDNHMVGQSFVVPAGIAKITRVKLTNFKFGSAGGNSGGPFSVALFKGEPSASTVTLANGSKTTQISAGNLVAKTEKILVGGELANIYAELCGVPTNTIEAIFLKRMRVNNPNRPCPKMSEWDRVYTLFTDNQQNLRDEWWNTFNGSFRHATYSGDSDLLWYTPGQDYKSQPSFYTGPGWTTQTVSWQGTDSPDNYLDVTLPDNTVTPGQSYFISIQQSHTNTAKDGAYYDGEYNCEGPNEAQWIDFYGMDEQYTHQETRLATNSLCDKSNVTVANISSSNPYSSGTSYFNTYYYFINKGDVTNLTIWGQSTTLVNNATCSSIAAPDTVTSGQNFSASVQMNNTGSTTWTSAGNYHLGSWDPQDNTTWGSNRANLSNEPVAPNTIGTFNFTATAPTVNIDTYYDFDWKMVQDGVEWFGTPCTKKIKVTQTQPSLSTLHIDANNADSVPGVRGPVYGLSGPRSAADTNVTSGNGSNYYNSLIIKQDVSLNGGSSNVNLVGMAFTSKASLPKTCGSVQGQNCLSSLMSSAQANNGFVLLYAVNTSSAGGTSFTGQKYYVYFFRNNLGRYDWGDPYTAPSLPQLFPNPQNDPLLLVRFPGFSGQLASVPFWATLYQSLGNRSYGTYQYLMDYNGNETLNPISPQY